MTSIRVDCQHCPCDYEMAPSEFELYQSNQTEIWLMFACLVCGEVNRRRMPEQAVAILLASGVRTITPEEVMARLLEDQAAIDRELLS